MATTIEYECCREISAITAKLDLLEDAIISLCLIQDFKLCLDVWVLQPPYNQYAGCCMMQAIVECSNKIKLSCSTHSVVVAMIEQWVHTMINLAVSQYHFTIKSPLSVRFSESVIIGSKLNGPLGLELFVSGELSVILSRLVSLSESSLIFDCCSHSSF